MAESKAKFTEVDNTSDLPDEKIPVVEESLPDTPPLEFEPVIDSRNYWGVSLHGKDGIQFGRYPLPRSLSHTDALVFAAWIVHTIDPTGKDFSRAYKAVAGPGK